MTTILPAWPRFVMTIFEPITLFAGAAAPFISPEYFVAEQIPQSKLAAVSDNNALVAYQLGNIYLLLALLGIGVLYTTTEAKVVRNYVIALWTIDITHIAVTIYGVGLKKSLDVPNWNPMTWGNIGVTAFLCLTRTLYLLGVFGPDRVLARTDQRKVQ